MNIIKFSRLPQNYFRIKSDGIYSNVKIISFKVSPKKCFISQCRLFNSDKHTTCMSNTIPIEKAFLEKIK